MDPCRICPGWSAFLLLELLELGVEVIYFLEIFGFVGVEVGDDAGFWQSWLLSEVWTIPWPVACVINTFTDMNVIFHARIFAMKICPLFMEQSSSIL